MMVARKKHLEFDSKLLVVAVDYLVVNVVLDVKLKVI